MATICSIRISDRTGRAARSLVLLVAMALGGCAAFELGAPAARSGLAANGGASATEPRLTPSALQREIFAFADRYNERIVQASAQAMSEAADSAARASVQGVRVAYLSSVLAIVSGPEPLAALRDLMVVVSLERQVWEEASSASSADRHAALMAAALRILEDEIFALATRAVPPRTIDDLKGLVAAWRRANPEQRFVAFIRFDKLGSLEQVQNVERQFASGGLLAPVDAVAREVHDARLLGERGVYLATRMPLLLTAQGEFLYQRLVASPEAQDTLENMRAYRSIMSRLAREVELAPDHLNAQGTALLDELFRRMAAERQTFLAETRRHVSAEREAIFGALADGAGTYGPLLAQIGQTMSMARDVTAGIERLQGASGPGVSGDASGGIERATEALDKIMASLVELRQLLNGMEKLVGKDANLQGLAAVDAMVSSQLRWLFIYAAALVLLLGGVLTVSLLVVHRVRRQRPP